MVLKYELYSDIDFIGVDEEGLVSSHRSLKAAINKINILIKDNPILLNKKNFGIYKNNKLIYPKQKKK